MEKQYVIDEIVRTAKANEGVPLGFRSFAQATGIQEYDWKGKFWARWGDALAEAGLERNQFKGAYPEQFLIEKIIPKIKKMGRFPVNNELHLFSYDEKDFPNAKTFQRLGSKRQLATKVLEYCNGKDDLDDVITACRRVIETSEKLVENIGSEVGKSPIVGFVYLLKFGRNYKIGKTNAVGRRERELVIQLPEQANMVHEIPTDDPGGIEAYWHKRFATQRKNGEWFELSVTDVAAFKRRKYM
jgi:Meiotically up-regulated gene 113